MEKYVIYLRKCLDGTNDSLFIHFQQFYEKKTQHSQKSLINIDIVVSLIDLLHFHPFSIVVDRHIHNIFLNLWYKYVVNSC